MAPKIWLSFSLYRYSTHQGRGYGREMLMECVVPYIRQHGATRLCFFTNSESNLAFYRHLGFEVSDFQELDCRGTKMGSWSIVYEIPQQQ